MADYKTYLAASILTEDKVVTYRLLSRFLKVHVNTAKEMLYEFHHQQNSKKPGTIHATYLLSGTKRQAPQPINGTAKHDEDTHMQSSPIENSSMPQLEENTGESGILTISLVKEEDLDQEKSQYDLISSIHVYSLGPHPLKDLQLLSDTTRELAILTTSEDPVDSASKYGTILNPLVKRRPNHRPPPDIAPAKLPTQAAKPKPAELAKEKEAPKIKQEQKGSQSSVTKDFFGKGKEKGKPVVGSGPSSKESTPMPPATLKRESSSIFKSFAKAKPKLTREDTNPSALEDVSMKGMEADDDDEEDTYVPTVSVKKLGVEAEGDRKSRKEREAALRKMMEDDDEEEASPISEREEEEADEEDEEETTLEKEDSPKEEEPIVTVSGGRRRGKRRVMRKKTIKDEEGYLVTKEEPAWESFSEEEPVAPKARSQISSAAPKAKKGGPKAGQGSIMSFFGKK